MEAARQPQNIHSPSKGQAQPAPPGASGITRLNGATGFAPPVYHLLAEPWNRIRESVGNFLPIWDRYGFTKKESRIFLEPGEECIRVSTPKSSCGVQKAAGAKFKMPGNLKAFTNDLAREGTLFVGAQLILHQGLALHSQRRRRIPPGLGSLWVNKKGRLKRSKNQGRNVPGCLRGRRRGTVVRSDTKLMRRRTGLDCLAESRDQKTRTAKMGPL
ncbi:hypothetical protein C8J57DRAFT_1243973 [Mycena rebaudengoi]|nr:hypothetical protein C8J57DRAFT_1243973 [Mycena rebaudengoi]